MNKRYYNPKTKKLYPVEEIERINRTREYPLDFNIRMVRNGDIIVGDYVIPIEEQTPEDKKIYFSEKNKSDPFEETLNVFKETQERLRNQNSPILKDTKTSFDDERLEKSDIDNPELFVNMVNNARNRKNAEYSSSQPSFDYFQYPRIERFSNADFLDDSSYERNHQDSEENYAQQYADAKRLSYPQKEFASKRNKRLIFKRVSAGLAAAVIAGGVIAGVKLAKMNNIINQNHDLIVSINSIGENNEHKQNAISKNTVQLPGLDASGKPLVYYKIHDIASEFLELPHQAVITNLYNYYNDFRHKNYMAYENDNVTNWDYFISLVGRDITKESEEDLAFELLHDCGTWQEFLERFAQKYNVDSPELMKEFDKKAKMIAPIDNEYLQYEYDLQTNSLQTLESQRSR